MILLSNAGVFIKAGYLILPANDWRDPTKWKWSGDYKIANVKVIAASKETGKKHPICYMFF